MGLVNNMRIVRIKKNNIINIASVELPQVQSDEVLVSNTFLGVNYIDIQQIHGVFKPASVVPGVEAVGKIECVGERVTDFKIGDRVGYCTLYGTYCEKKIIKSQHLIRIPDDIPDDVVVAVLFKGMIAHSLLRRVYILQPDARVLVHDANTDVGQLICQWADYLKAIVIGTVNDDSKANTALDNGCEYVLNYRDVDCATNIMDLTKELGVHAVYDSVGLNTCKLSFEVLTTFGVYALYYETSGAVPQINPQILKSRSTFFTYASVFHYKTNRFEMGMAAREIFHMVRMKYLKPKIAKVYNLTNVEEALKDLDIGNLDGQLIIKI